MEKGKKGKGHGHPWIAGLIGLIAAIVLLIKMPEYKFLTGTVMAFAIAHLILALVILTSAYLVIPRKIITMFTLKHHKNGDDGKLNFGWSYGWMNIYWVFCLLFLLASILVYLVDNQLIWLSFLLLIIAFQLFAGNIVLRISKKLEYMTLPYVDLLSSGNDLILDAGCGSGRTTVELSKVMKNSRIVALDRFDSDYIKLGGRALLERNLATAGITDRVDIVKGDITALEFDDNHFDTAISSYMMDHLGNYKLPALKEVSRTLKPGGKFLLIVFVPNWLTFSVFNAFCFSLTSRKGWRNLFKATDLKLKQEGAINGGIYFLLQK